MIRFEYQGREYDFRGEYLSPKDGSYHLDGDGDVRKANMDYPAHQIRAIVHPVPRRHTFGKLTFREAGEPRKIKNGEWGLVYGQPRFFSDFDSADDYIPLEPESIG